MKIELGQQVESKKNGAGVISKIITKSTGYVEITYINGLVKKEMMKGLNSAPKTYIPRFDSNGMVTEAYIDSQNTSSKIAKNIAQGEFSKMKVSYLNEDGSRNEAAHNKFLSDREAAAWGSKSF